MDSKIKKSGFGISKGIGPFTKEDELLGQLEEKEMRAKKIKMKEQLGIKVKKEEDFSEWYSQVIQKSGLADYTSVSGCIVFRPYAYAIWEKIKKEIDKRIKKMGVQNAYFPLFIPEKLLKKEAENFKGFSPEVAWVTEAGNSKLDERLAIRPTSEAIMYESYAKWIRSWRDLPLKLNQWNNVVRWEFKYGVPFLRTREFLWNEGHTAFATQKEAEEEVYAILTMYDQVLQEYFALYGLLGRKTKHEKFAGAEYTLTIEIIMPNGKAIQGPDAHYDGQNFAKAFGITFLDKDEKEKHVYQNTWAITTRMIGVLVAVHGDDKGLVLPPKLAPHKAVVIPILIGKDKGAVLKKGRALAQKLKKFDCIFDDRESYTPGWKFNEWEIKGVPVRIEIGPQDIKQKQVVLVRRDANKKIVIEEKAVVRELTKILEEMQENLYAKSKTLTEDNIIAVDNLNALRKAIDKKKIVEAFLCEDVHCESSLKEINGIKTLNIPFKQPLKKEPCVVCKKESAYLVRIGKSY